MENVRKFRKMAAKGHVVLELKVRLKASTSFEGEDSRDNGGGVRVLPL
jgi:hypothetical protein